MTTSRKFPVAWGCFLFQEPHNGYLEFICNWDVGPVMTTLFNVQLYTGLSVWPLVRQDVFLRKTPAVTLELWEKLITVRTSPNNCSCQKSKFSTWLHSHKGKTQKPNRYLKSVEVSSLLPAFDVTAALMCAISHSRSPCITHVELSELPNLIHGGC